MLDLLYARLQSDLEKYKDKPNDSEEIRRNNALLRDLAKRQFDNDLNELIKNGINGYNGNNDELLSEIKKLNENMSKLLDGQKEANNRLDDIHFRQSFYS